MIRVDEPVIVATLAAIFVAVALLAVMRHPRFRKLTSWESRSRHRRRHSLRQARQRGRRAA